MAYPKIIYNPVTPTTLTFTFPPVSKPMADDRIAQRTDSTTLSGLRQSVFERTDTMKVLQMDNVPIEDMDDWAAFIDWAVQGGEFDYYPDSSSSTHTVYTLDDVKWQPKRNISGPQGTAKFAITLREVITPAVDSILDGGSF